MTLYQVSYLYRYNKFRRFSSNRFGPKTFGERGRAWPPSNHATATQVLSYQISSRYVKPLGRNYGNPPENLTPRLPPFRSLDVVGIDTDRSAACDFLLVFHSNRGPLSYRFSDKRRFLSKIANFSHPRVFKVPAKGVSFGIL